jgi:acyl carrier protein
VLGDHVKHGGWCTRQDIFRKIQFVLAESLNIEPEEIQPGKNLRDDLGAV